MGDDQRDEILPEQEPGGTDATSADETHPAPVEKESDGEATGADGEGDAAFVSRPDPPLPTPALAVEDIQPILQEVLETLNTRELEVQDREGRWHLLRARPFRALENKIEGLVVVPVDIDHLRRSQQSMMEARDYAHSVVESVPVPILVLNTDLTIRSVNSAFCGLVQLKTDELDGRSLPDLAAHLWGLEDMKEKLEPLRDAVSGAAVEFERESTTPRYKMLLIKARKLITDGSPVLLLMVEDITLRREAERLFATQKLALEGEIESAARKLNQTQDALRDLTGHLFTAQEEERQHVARELHDDVSQRLSLLEMLLQEIRGTDTETDLEKLETARQQLSALNTDVRQISHRLHPAILNDLGLSAALQALVKEFGERENMPASYSTHNLPESWPPEAANAIYRITQEAMRNISKHAGKTHVKVALAGTAGGLELKVMDFGIGFDQDTQLPTPGLGMISMQERARLAGGTLNVQSALGQGTTVTVDIPLDPHG